jgi:hypothetical protein
MKSGDISAFNKYVSDTYDSSADYWKLTKNGMLEYDGDGYLKNEKGEFILDKNGKKIGAADAGDGLNQFLGITNGKEVVSNLLKNWHSIQSAPLLNMNMNALLKYAPDIALTRYCDSFGGYGNIPEEEISKLLEAKLGAQLTGEYVDQGGPSFRTTTEYSSISALVSMIQGDHSPVCNVYSMGMDKSPLVRSLLFMASPDGLVHAASYLTNPTAYDKPETPGAEMETFMESQYLYNSLSVQEPSLNLKIGVQNQKGEFSQQANNKFIPIPEAEGMTVQKSMLASGGIIGDVINPLLEKYANAKALNNVYLYTRQTDGEKYYSVYAPVYTGVSDNSFEFDYRWITQKTFVSMYPNLVKGIIYDTIKPYKSYETYKATR